MKIIIYDHLLTFKKDKANVMSVKFDNEAALQVADGDTLSIGHVADFTFWHFVASFLFGQDLIILPKKLKKGQTSGKFKYISTIEFMHLKKKRKYTGV